MKGLKLFNSYVWRVDSVLNHILDLARGGKKMLAVLIDPDIILDRQVLISTVQNACMARVDMLLVGGSLLHTDRYQECVSLVKELADIPVVLFPGGPDQVSGAADAMLFLSLISGRNPEFLIGHHVTAAPKIKKLGLEAIPTGYMLVDGGSETTAHYVSQTQSIPYEKDGIAASTAMAGELLGLQLLYMDTGSGAKKPVSPAMIKAVKHASHLPLIVGGGIRNAQQLNTTYSAGADVVVVGNAFEEDPELIFTLAEAVPVRI